MAHRSQDHHKAQLKERYKVGETASYSALYIITQAADAGGISNQASATASSPGNSNDVSDMSDDGDDSDGNTTDDPTVTSITASSLLEVTKTAVITDNGGDGNTGAGRYYQLYHNGREQGQCDVNRSNPSRHFN